MQSRTQEHTLPHLVPGCAETHQIKLEKQAKSERGYIKFLWFYTPRKKKTKVATETDGWKKKTNRAEENNTESNRETVKFAERRQLGIQMTFRLNTLMQRHTTNFVPELINLGKDASTQIYFSRCLCSAQLFYYSY